MVFGNRNDFRLAVSGARRRENYVSDVVFDQSIEQFYCFTRIVSKINSGIFYGFADVCIRRKMNTRIDVVIADDLPDKMSVAYVSDIEWNFRVDGLSMTARQIIEYYRRFTARSQQLSSNAANVSGPTSDKYGHYFDPGLAHT